MTPDEGAQAGLQFHEGERLGQVVVRTAVQTRHPVRNGLARSQDHHGQVAPAFAQALEHVQPIHAREAKVQYQGVVGFAGEGEIGRHPVADPVDAVAFLSACAQEQIRQRGIIFGQQDAHRCVSGIV